MNCEQAEELLGAYALDALSPEEMAETRAHIAGCSDHAAKAAELRTVAASLHTLAEPLRPPPALRGRIAAAISATPGTPAALPPVTPRRIDSARSAPRAVRQQWRPMMAFGALAASAVIAVTGLFAWNMSLQNGDDGAAVTAVRPLLQDSGATAGYIVLFGEDGEARVVSDALPQLDASQSYQLWSLSALGEPTSLGLMEPGDGGQANATVRFDTQHTRQIAITIEPAGGSEQPTTPALYVADL